MLNQSITQIVGASTILLTAFLLIAVARPRLALGLLFFQYAGVFLVISADWSLTLSLIKVLAGWAAVFVLGTSSQTFPKPEQPSETHPQANSRMYRILYAVVDSLSGNIFYLLAGVLVLLVVVSITPQAVNWIPGAGILSVFAGLLLISLGLLQLGLTRRILKVIIGLLTFLSGFEIIYAAVENSALVTGLLAGVTMALSLAGAYLISINEAMIDT